MMFNVFGIILFYPVRYIRQALLECARSLGYQVRKRCVHEIKVAPLSFGSL